MVFKILFFLVLLDKSSLSIGRVNQDLESGCLTLAILRFLGVQPLKGDHNILRHNGIISFPLILEWVFSNSLYSRVL